MGLQSLTGHYERNKRTLAQLHADHHIPVPEFFSKEIKPLVDSKFGIQMNLLKAVGMITLGDMRTVTLHDLANGIDSADKKFIHALRDAVYKNGGWFYDDFQKPKKIKEWLLKFNGKDTLTDRELADIVSESHTPVIETKFVQKSAYASKGESTAKEVKKAESEPVEPVEVVEIPAPVVDKPPKQRKARGSGVPTDEEIAAETRPVWKHLLQTFKDEGDSIMQAGEKSGVHFTTLYASKNGKNGKDYTLSRAVVTKIYKAYGLDIEKLPQDALPEAKEPKTPKAAAPKVPKEKKNSEKKTRQGRMPVVPTDEEIAAETRPVWKNLMQLMKEHGDGVMQMADKSGLTAAYLYGSKNAKEGKEQPLSLKAVSKIYTAYGKVIDELPEDALPPVKEKKNGKTSKRKEPFAEPEKAPLSDDDKLLQEGMRRLVGKNVSCFLMPLQKLTSELPKLFSDNSALVRAKTKFMLVADIATKSEGEVIRHGFDIRDIKQMGIELGKIGLRYDMENEARKLMAQSQEQSALDDKVTDGLAPIIAEHRQQLVKKYGFFQ